MRAGTKPGLMALPLPLPCSDKGALLLPPRTGAIGPGVCPAALAGGRGAVPAPAVVPEPSSVVLALSRTALLWPGVPAGAAFGSRSLARVSPVPAISAAAQEGAPGAPACPGSPRPARGTPEVSGWVCWRCQGSGSAPPRRSCAGTRSAVFSACWGVLPLTWISVQNSLREAHISINYLPAPPDV